ncbi:unnamed protein product [Rotaria sordida]|uniref:TIR domain-containing protein n=2 Tax=Rotaria sordida TaxID=392033 RepID=A0A814JBB5_9BILA|nr:unnamed protein product [Rotaria sordida]CAF3721822.1 unnamed protein product [Rotaria sordida]
MLSYQKETRKTVDEIYHLLKQKLHINVWMDKQGGITNSVTRDMAHAVENAICICCFITPKYQESKNCESELSYALSRGVPVIPIYMAEKGWKPSSWLGFKIHDLLHLNFRDTNETNISEKFQELVDKIYAVVPDYDLQAAMAEEGGDGYYYGDDGAYSEGEGSNVDGENNDEEGDDEE